MKKEFLTYDQALALRKLGFDEPCIAKYTRDDNQNIFWLRISESSVDMNKKTQTYGKPVNYNTSIYWSEGTISAPTYSQAFRWFREKHKLVVNQERDGGWWIFTIKDIYDEDEQGAIDTNIDPILEDTYEEAESACINKLIEKLS